VKINRKFRHSFVLAVTVPSAVAATQGRTVTTDAVTVASEFIRKEGDGPDGESPDLALFRDSLVAQTTSAPVSSPIILFEPGRFPAAITAKKQ
jgi:hypothetical protein